MGENAFTYVVRGHWPFPTDMLRHDVSRAASPEDQGLIDELSQEFAPDLAAFKDVSITLVGFNKPNTARWESFGWAVPGDEDHRLMQQLRKRDSERAALRRQAMEKLTPEEREALGLT